MRDRLKVVGKDREFDAVWRRQSGPNLVPVGVIFASIA